MSTTASTRAAGSMGVSTRSFSTIVPSSSTTPPAIFVPPMSIPTLRTALPSGPPRGTAHGSLATTVRPRRHPPTGECADPCD